MSITIDGNGVVFDVTWRYGHLPQILSGSEIAATVSLEVVKELLHLQEREPSGGRFGGGGRGGCIVLAQETDSTVEEVVALSEVAASPVQTIKW